MTLADSPSLVVIRAGVRLGMAGTGGQALPMAKRTDPKGKEARTVNVLASHGRVGILSGW